jgi:hypothetical protein
MKVSIEQKVRAALVTTIASYDEGTVAFTAIENDAEFFMFLNREINAAGIDAEDYEDIILEMEIEFGIALPDVQSVTWKDFYELLVREVKAI